MEVSTSYKTYWQVWGVLLVLTLFMLLFESLEVSATVTIVVLVVAMLAKASLIGGWFMHLRFERASLAVTLVVVTLVTVAFLFFLLIPDALTVARSAGP